MGVGLPVIIIIIVVVLLVLKRSSSKANSVTELTGKNISSQIGGNKVTPTTDFEDGKHTALGNYKANEPSLTSANMLTNPDLTTDE